MVDDPTHQRMTPAAGIWMYCDNSVACMLPAAVYILYLLQGPASVRHTKFELQTPVLVVWRALSYPLGAACFFAHAPCRFWRVGTVVMLLHDANDVLMEAAKLAKYRNQEDLATGLFASFTVAWLLLRLLCYPLLVIRSTMFEFPKVIDVSVSVYYMFNALLCMLLVLHVYWFSLILRIVYMTLTTGGAHDVREEDDDS
jgi:hypothetical protein